MNLENITLLDVIDRDTLQALQDAFAEATGMAALATDETGAVTHLSCPTDFCMNFMRKNKVGCDRCNQCDLNGGSEANRTGRPSVYYCHAGLVDFAAPIIVNGRHIGSLIGGQVLPEPPQEEKFRGIARELGMSPDALVKAVNKVSIVPKSRIDSAANLLYHMANALSDVGYQKAVALEKIEEEKREAAAVSEMMVEINQNITDAVSMVQSIEDSVGSIKDATAVSTKAVDSTDAIVKTIEAASTQLTLIGFNASIEAKRAGAAGAGFNVIAQEVRTLANKNAKQAAEIDSTLGGIRSSMNDINNRIKAVYGDIEKCVETISQLSDTLEKNKEKL